MVWTQTAAGLNHLAIVVTQGRGAEEGEPMPPSSHLHDVSPARALKKKKIMAVVDPVFEELLEKEGDEKRGLWRVQNLELVPVPEG